MANGVKKKIVESRIDRIRIPIIPNDSRICPAAAKKCKSVLRQTTAASIQEWLGQDFNSNTGEPLSFHPQSSCRSGGKVNHAASHIRASVGYFHHDGAPVFQVGYAHFCSERQAAMRGCEFIGMKPVSGGSAPSFKTRPVVAGSSHKNLALRQTSCSISLALGSLPESHNNQKNRKGDQKWRTRQACHDRNEFRVLREYPAAARLRPPGCGGVGS